MRNKKGFTLIELIAVIVILAGVALITFPALLNQINGTKGQISDSLQQIISSSVKSYIDANRNEFISSSDHSYIIAVSDLVNKNYLSKSMLDSIKDNSGNDYDRIIVSYDNNNYTYKLMKKDVDYGCQYKPVLTTANVGVIAASENPFRYGTEYNCQVGDSESERENFYVLAENDDSVLLLMIRNLDDSITNWCKDNNNNNCGAVTAKQVLSEKTSEWIFKTSLPTLDQLSAANGGYTNRPASWIIANLPYSVNGEEKKGYWTSTPCLEETGTCAPSNGKYKYAYAVNYNSAYTANVHQVGTNKDEGGAIKLIYGIRPVIVVPKELIEVPS